MGAVEAGMAEGNFTRSVYAAMLHRALIFSRTEVADKLLMYAPSMLQLPYGKMVDEHFTQSPVHAAVIVGDVERVSKLIESGFDPEEAWTAQASHLLPLQMASNLGHTALIDLLAKKKGPKFAASREDTLALCLNGAAVDGHLEAVKKLHKLGAKLNMPNDRGHFGVHVAAGGGQHHVLKFILQKDRSLVNQDDDERNKPLHCAAEHGHKAATEFLLGKRAKLSVYNDKGMQPLHLAAQQGHVTVIDALLKAKANVHDTARGEGQGSAPLHFAAGNGALGAAEFLIEMRAHVDALAGGDMTPLHVAGIMGSGRFMPEFLVQHRAQLDARNVQDMNPLTMARHGGDSPTIAILERLTAEAKQSTGRKKKTRKTEREGGVASSKVEL